jgi:hypothetical protein
VVRAHGHGAAVLVVFPGWVDHPAVVEDDHVWSHAAQVADGPADAGVSARKVSMEDLQRPLEQVAGLGRLPQPRPCGPQVVEDVGHLAVVGIELPLLDAQRPPIRYGVTGDGPQSSNSLNSGVFVT